MKQLIVETSHGPLNLVGRLHPETARPALVIMGGIWAPADQFHEIVAWFPGASVVIALLPGMRESQTPRFEAALMTRMLDEAIGYLFRGVPLVAFGVSTGSLVTLGLQSPGIVRQVALEPFFRTAPLWPLLDFTHEFLVAEPDNAGAALAADSLFGFTRDTVTDRDYRNLLWALRTPTDIILGGQPLEPRREMDGWPSLTSAEDRATLAAHPLVTLHHGAAASGHNLGMTPSGAKLIYRVLLEALKSAIPR